MASTSPFPEEGDVAGPRDGEGDGHRPRHGRRASRRARALRDGSAEAREARLIDGFPDWKGLWPVVSFLAFPAMMAVGIALTRDGWPKELLYPLAGLLGLYVLLQAFRGQVELVLACTLFYLPFSTTYVIPIAPGLNGTNMLLLLGLFAALMGLSQRRTGFFDWPRGTFAVFLFGALTAFSAFTVTLLPGGYEHLVYSEILSYKAWLDQFVFYFIALCCIRDAQTAKRVFVYLCLGSIVLVIYAIPEMLDKLGRSTIDKSRIGGPHQQANNFGGFVAYTLLPVIAVFVTYIRDLRFWLLVPYFLLGAKVLITTFSRGAYLAMAFGSLLAGYFRGRGFLAFWLSLVLCFFLVVPSALPESVMVRLDSITKKEANTTSQDVELDKSSQHRLVLWRAAGKMIMEDPVLGKGFKGFKYVKSQYTEQDVHESDPHNMYLYIASQMGLPALSLFLLILAWAFQLGRLLSRDPDDRFVRAIGIGGASATACYAAICLFGSRAVNLEFTAYFWAMLVVMQVLRRDQVRRMGESAPKRRRGSAFDAVASDGGAGASTDDADERPVTARRRTRRVGAGDPAPGAADSRAGSARRGVAASKVAASGGTTRRSGIEPDRDDAGDADRPVTGLRRPRVPGRRRPRSPLRARRR